MMASAHTDRVRLWEKCPSHPEPESLDIHGLLKGSTKHECMAAELRCVYCGAAIEPVQCNGCGQWMSAKDLHDGESRCEDCV